MDHFPPPHGDGKPAPLCCNDAPEHPESFVEDFADRHNLDRRDETAGRVKRELQDDKIAIPPFLRKLSFFLSEPDNGSIIRWSDKGDSFIIFDQDIFAERLLPRLFKHKNFASFVRQLNMYGFQKCRCLFDNSMRASKFKIRSPVEYQHLFFRRGRPELLLLITSQKFGRHSKKVNEERGLDVGAARNLYPSIASSTPQTASENWQENDIIAAKRELDDVREQQARAHVTIDELQRNDANLRNQALLFQNQHKSHEKSINAILDVLAPKFSKCGDSVSANTLNDATSGIHIDQGRERHDTESVSNTEDLLRLQLSPTPSHGWQRRRRCTSTQLQLSDTGTGPSENNTSELYQSTGRDAGLAFADVLSGASQQNENHDQGAEAGRPITKGTCTPEPTHFDVYSSTTRMINTLDHLHPTFGHTAATPVAPAMLITPDSEETDGRAVELESCALPRTAQHTSAASSSSQTVSPSAEQLLSRHADLFDIVHPERLQGKITDSNEPDVLFRGPTPTSPMHEAVGVDGACCISQSADLEPILSG